jgi:hypothetical protein
MPLGITEPTFPFIRRELNLLGQTFAPVNALEAALATGAL